MKIYPNATISEIRNNAIIPAYRPRPTTKKYEKGNFVYLYEILPSGEDYFTAMHKPTGIMFQYENKKWKRFKKTFYDYRKGI